MPVSTAYTVPPGWQCPGSFRAWKFSVCAWSYFRCHSHQETVLPDLCQELKIVIQVHLGNSSLSTEKVGEQAKFRLTLPTLEELGWGSRLTKNSPMPPRHLRSIPPPKVLTLGQQLSNNKNKNLVKISPLENTGGHLRMGKLS